VSLGIAFAPEHGTSVGQLLKRADLALYEAKSANKGGYCCFEPTIEEKMTVRLQLQTDLRAAIAHHQFELLYQPVVNLANRTLHGAEALVRWNHPQRGMVLPNQFISVAEEMGLIIELGEWILQTACVTAVGWAPHLKVAINLSPVQFWTGDLIGAVKRAIAESGLRPDRIELEITESVLLHNNVENVTLLHRLKDLGVSIVLYDFGTGYSSLSYLKRFPFDLINIDQSFVRELTRRADCDSIVCAIVGLGRGLNILTTAEGVATEQQCELLRAAGCTFGQGHLFGRPVPNTRLGFAAENYFDQQTTAA
jgi:predicted signal transduction protein with EAL and GGDEF domain